MFCRTIIHWLNEIDPNRGWKMLVTQLPCDCSVSSLAVPKAPTGKGSSQINPKVKTVSLSSIIPLDIIQ